MRINLDVAPFAQNLLPFAAYADSEAFVDLQTSGHKLTARHYKRSAVAASVAAGVFSNVTDLTWAEQHPGGWWQYVQGRKRAFGSRWIPNPLLTENKVLRALCAPNQFALGTCDRFQEMWTNPRRLEPSVSAIRIDLDADSIFESKDVTGVKALIGYCHSAAADMGLTAHVLATGRRGLQVICPLPGLVFTPHGLVLSDAFKALLKARLPENLGVSDFKDGVRNIMRLPLMLHAHGALGLFLNEDGSYMSIDDQVARGQACFKPIVGPNDHELPLLVDSLLTGLGVSDHDFPSDMVVSECTNQVVMALTGSSTNAVATPLTSPHPILGARQTLPTGRATNRKLDEICAEDVQPGDTFRYLTSGHGVWAHVAVYGDDAEDMLVKKMLAIPGSPSTVEQRLATVRGLLSKFKTFQRNQEQQTVRRGSLPVIAHGDDVLAARAFVKNLGWRRDRSRNAEMVRMAELHIRRFARPDDDLFAGDCHRVAKVLFGDYAPNRRTVERIYWSEEFMNSRS